MGDINTSDYKRSTIKVYNKHAEVFEKYTKDFSKNNLMDDVVNFTSSLNGKDILDLGSGPGRDSLFFKEQGLNPLCLDLSSEMIKLCKEKDLEGVVGDLEKLSFKDESFDGVWAVTSLLHIPKKNLSSVLENVNRILKPKGIFYVVMKQGNFEGWLKSEKYSENSRFFSFYSKEELVNELKPFFKINYGCTRNIKEAAKKEGTSFLSYLCEKK